MALQIEYWTGLGWQDITFDIPFLGDPIPGLVPFQMELTRESNVSVMRFGINGGSYSGLATGTEVRLRENATVFFGGYITTRERVRQGTLYGANFECQDYNSVMDRIVVTGHQIDDGDVDSTEIQALRLNKLNGLGITNGTITTINNDMDEVLLRGTFREAMETIAGQAGGAFFFIDKDKQLHYFPTTNAFAPAATENLSDDLSVANSYPYNDFVERVDETRRINRVYIVGDGVEGWYPAADSGEVYQALVHDTNIKTQDQLDLLGAAIVDDFGSALTEYSLRCWEDAFLTEGTVTVRHSDFIAGSTDLWIRRVVMVALSDDGAERELILELGDHTVESDIISGGPGSPGGTRAPPLPHSILNDAFHSDAADHTAAEGDLIVANSDDKWDGLTHPDAAGHALVTSATTWTIDQTPTWTGNHTWDDGSGNSPFLRLVSESDDVAFIYLANSATPGNSDLTIVLCADDADSRFQVRNSSLAVMAWIDAVGDASFYDVNVAAAHGLIHATANTDGFVWRCDGTRAYPTALSAGDIPALGGTPNLTLSTSNAAGAAGTYVRTDATILAFDVTTPTAILPDDAASTGAASVAARRDHVHEITCAAPSGTITEATANAEGAASTFARSDHTHDIDVSGTYAPNDAQYLVLALDGDLSAERRFVPGDGLAGTDGGANGDYDLAVDLVAVWSGLEFSSGRLRVDLDATYNAWTGAHTHASNVILDDGTGNSPQFRLVGGSNDDVAILYLVDNATINDSDLALALCADDSDSRLLIRNASLATVAWIDAVGDADFGDLTLDEYITHDGDTDTWIRFRDDQITLRAGGVDLLDIIEGATDYVLFRGNADLNNNDLIFDADGDSYAHAAADDQIELVIASNAQYNFAATQLTISNTSGDGKLWLRTHGDVALTAADIYADDDLGLAAEDNIWMFIDTNASGTNAHFSIGNNGENVDGIVTPLFRVTEGPEVLINTTSGTNMTVGIKIDQDTATDDIAAFVSNITHGMTTHAETGVFGQARQTSGTYGGLLWRGLRDDSSGTAAWKAAELTGYLGENADTTKGTGGHGVVSLNAAIKSGTTVTSVNSDGNLVSIEDQTAARFLFDAEGEMHSDAVIGAGDDWDDWDDLALAADISRLPKARWAEMMKYQADDFERAGLITLSTDADGTRHAFIKHKAMLQFYACCFREVGQKLARYERALIELGVSPAQLTA